jgi:hypothetical protein
VLWHGDDVFLQVALAVCLLVNSRAVSSPPYVTGACAPGTHTTSCRVTYLVAYSPAVSLQPGYCCSCSCAGAEPPSNGAQQMRLHKCVCVWGGCCTSGKHTAAVAGSRGWWWPVVALWLHVGR